MRWYRTTNRDHTITPVEVVRETPNFVWFNDKQRADKAGEYRQYHRTWGEAWQMLYERELRRRALLERRLAEAQIAIDELRALTPPEDEGAA